MPLDADVENGTAVFEVVERLLPCPCRRHKRMEAEPLLLQGDAHEDAAHDADAARDAPQHVGRVHGRVVVARLSHEILLIGGEQGGGAVDGRDAVLHRLLVASQGRRPHPVGLDEGPHRVVMVGVNVRNLGRDTGGAEGVLGHRGDDALGTPRLGDAEDDAQGLAQGLAAGGDNQVSAAIKILAVVALLLNP